MMHLGKMIGEAVPPPSQRELCAQGFACPDPCLQHVDGICRNRLRTLAACRCTPRAVRMPRSFTVDARSVGLVTPDERSISRIRRTFTAKASATLRCVAASGVTPLSLPPPGDS